MVEPKVVIYPFGDRAYTSTLYYGADVRESLRTLKTGSVQCVVTSPPYWGLRSYLPEGSDLKGSEIGLESMPDEYVKSMTEVFREVRRVLREDGVLWLNLGDSYTSGSRRTTSRAPDSKDSKGGRENDTRPPTPSGLKPKDLVGIPWMVAFALRADGWYLRSDIIWAKGNPMPESVVDRPTRSHEYIFLLTKSREYFYDHVAVKEPVADATRKDMRIGRDAVRDYANAGESFGAGTSASRRMATNSVGGEGGLRNQRSVWAINPKPYKGAHFATMPTTLAELCIKAGSSEKGCCPACGAPWARVAEHEQVPDRPGRVQGREGDTLDEAHGKDGRAGNRRRVSSRTVGWEPTCNCPEHEPVPCVILDPFSGSGTTGYVSNRLGRNYVGTDLNTEYLPLAEARLLGMDPPEDDELTEDSGDTASIMDMFGGG